MLRWATLTLMLLAGCTIDVQVPRPDVTIDCVVVTVPLRDGGVSVRDCDAGDDGE